jgi:hypothetical protein
MQQIRDVYQITCVSKSVPISVVFSRIDGIERAVSLKL